MKSGADNTSKSFKEGDCMPNDTDKPDRTCNVGHYQMVLFAKVGEEACPKLAKDLLPAFTELG